MKKHQSVGWFPIDFEHTSLVLVRYQIFCFLFSYQSGTRIKFFLKISNKHDLTPLYWVRD
jgi:hypothetical protein